MKAHDREVGGIRCYRVLELLSEFLDGELDAATRSQVEVHLRGCDWCEKFGGEMGELLADARRLLGPQSDDEEARKRLHERVSAALDDDG